jgi:hypothetical protein
LNILSVWLNCTLPLSQPGVLLGFDTGRFAPGHEMPVGFNFTQNTTHLHHLLEAV